MNKSTDKTFYIISSLSSESSFTRLSERKAFPTEKEARSAAKSLVLQRQTEGRTPLSFFILKAVFRVGYALPPISERKLK